MSFRQGDIIQVITQLESGWWDGVLNDNRAWFPSNYCTYLTSVRSKEDTGSDTEGEDKEEQDSEPITGNDSSRQPIKDGCNTLLEELAFWIPQATPDGRLYYYNMRTGQSSMELPLDENMTQIRKRGLRRT